MLGLRPPPGDRHALLLHRLHERELADVREEVRVGLAVVVAHTARGVDPEVVRVGLERDVVARVADHRVARVAVADVAAALADDPRLAAEVLVARSACARHGGPRTPARGASRRCRRGCCRRGRSASAAAARAARGRRRPGPRRPGGSCSPVENDGSLTFARVRRRFVRPLKLTYSLPPVTKAIRLQSPRHGDLRGVLRRLLPPGQVERASARGRGTGTRNGSTRPLVSLLTMFVAGREEADARRRAGVEAAADGGRERRPVGGARCGRARRARSAPGATSSRGCWSGARAGRRRRRSGRWCRRETMFEASDWNAISAR